MSERTRWEADAAAAFAAEIDTEIVGSNFATNWGTVGFFGPVTIHPDLWDKGLGKRLMEPIMDCFDKWKTRHAGLFTFAHSPKHVALYQKFGFSPRFLTAAMSNPVEPIGRASSWAKFSDAPMNERAAIFDACRELTGAIYNGLDVARKLTLSLIKTSATQFFFLNGSKLTGLAVCHSGAGTEAGSDACYVKFGATSPGARMRSAISFACLMPSMNLLSPKMHRASSRGSILCAQERTARCARAAFVSTSWV